MMPLNQGTKQEQQRIATLVGIFEALDVHSHLPDPEPQPLKIWVDSSGFDQVSKSRVTTLRCSFFEAPCYCVALLFS